MKIFIVLTFILLSHISSYSQSGFPEWDAKYRVIVVSDLLKGEKEYAIKTESDSTKFQYYIRLESFRFIGRFTGNMRNISSKSYQSMINVYNLKYGNSKPLENILSENSKEVEIDIGEKNIWMPIQDILIEPFINEVRINQRILLYTMFTNEHTENKETINTFLISEFTSSWKAL